MEVISTKVVPAVPTVQGQSGFGSTPLGKNFLARRKDGIKKLAVVSGASTPY